tara:strand:+ start:149 stop:673 length:525 start_codon:yes stop_codon:yes gene_type:complete
MRALLIVSFFIFSCLKEDSEISVKSSLDYPDQESWGVTIILSDVGIERARIESGHLEKHNKKEFIMLKDSVKVDFFDKEERHVSTLFCSYAEVNQSSNNMVAINSVVAVSDSGITLFTDTLIWDSKQEKMHTKDSIMITTVTQDTLYGIGFESDSDLKNWKILKPSGVTANAKS